MAEVDTRFDTGPAVGPIVLLTQTRPADLRPPQPNINFVVDPGVKGIYEKAQPAQKTRGTAPAEHREPLGPRFGAPAITVALDSDSRGPKGASLQHGRALY